MKKGKFIGIIASMIAIITVFIGLNLLSIYLGMPIPIVAKSIYRLFAIFFGQMLFQFIVIMLIFGLFSIFLGSAFFYHLISNFRIWFQ